MSQELIEKIEIGHEGFSRGDLTEAKENVSDDVEWGTTGAWPGLEGTYRGKNALDEWMETLHSEWEKFGVSLDGAESRSRCRYSASTGPRRARS